MTATGIHSAHARSGRVRSALPILALFFLLAAAIGTHLNAQERGMPEESAGKNSYSPTPSFIANKGQWNPAARYQLSAGGLRAWFADGGVHYDLVGADGTRHVLRWSLIGAGTVHPEGSERENAWRSWIVGKKLIEDVPAYSRIDYSDLLPGVDVRFRFRDGGLKYDLILAPGVDPAQVRMCYEGAYGIELDSEGGLQVRTAGGILSEARPVLYQEIEGRRVPVEGHFILEEDRFGIEVGDYDSAYSLVIDPAIRFSTYLGGNGFDEGREVQIDTAGNVYVVGMTRSDDFPVTAGVFDQTLDSENGSRDLFVVKLDPTGRRLIWGTYVGGNGEDNPTGGMRITRDGHLIVAGTTLSSDFPVTQDVFPEGRRDLPGADGFVLSLNQFDKGRKVTRQWAAYLGGVTGDTITGLDLTSSDDIVLAGYTSSFDFQFLLPPGGFDLTPSGSIDAFVMAISGDGKRIAAGTFLGGAADDRATDIAVGAGDRITVAGRTASDGFPVTANAFSSARAGLGDGFVAQLSAGLQTLDYGTFLGGSREDFIRSVALDALGMIYVTGHTESNDFPDNVGLSSPGSWFVSKIDPTALSPGQLPYSLYLTSSPLDKGIGLEVDNQGRATLYGVTASGSFPIRGNGIATPGRGKSDLAFVRLASDGKSIEQSSVAGGAEDDIPAEGIVLSSPGDLYVTGSTRSANFPLGRFPFDNSLNKLPGEPEPDAFLLVWSFNPRPNLTAPSLLVMDTLRCDSVVRDTFYLYNDGDLPVVITANNFRVSEIGFTLDKPAEIPNPPDTIKPGDSLRYIVKYTSTGFGAAENDLIIYNSDSLLGKAPLTVTLRAARFAPSVLPSESTVRFGNVPACRDSVIAFTLTNNNADSVTVEFPTFVFGGRGFTIVGATFPLGIPGRGKKTFALVFDPAATNLQKDSTYNDTLVFRVRECDQSVLKVRVNGIGQVLQLAGLPDSIGFAPLPFCSSDQDTTITVTNNSSFNLIVQDLQIEGEGFSAQFQNGTPDVLAPKESRNLRIRFIPPTPGEYNAEALIRITPCDSVIRVRLVGSHPDAVVPVPAVDTLDFGTMLVCASERKFMDSVIRIDNPSDSVIVLGAPVLPAPFKACGIPLPTIPPGSFTTLCLEYDPPTEDRNDTVVLAIPYSAGDCTDTLHIVLIGGERVTRLLPELTTIDLPPLDACETFRDTVLVVRNTSVVPITLDSSHTTRGADVPGPTFPQVIAAGDSLTVQLRFAPVTSGTSVESVRLFYSSGSCSDTIDVTLRGNAEGIVVVSDRDTLRFAPILLCDPPGSVRDTVRISWTGSTTGDVRIASLQILGSGGSLLVDSAAIIGAPIGLGESLPIPLLFSSGTEGGVQDTLQVVVEPCMDTILVLLTGEVVEPKITITGGAFGDVELRTPASNNIVIVNESPIPLTLDTLFAAGLPFGLGNDFPNLPITLEGGGVIVLPLTFLPTATGEFRDSILLSFSEACERRISVQLSGTGIISEAAVEFCIGGTYSDPGVVGDTVVIAVQSTPSVDLEASADLLFRFRFDFARFQFAGVEKGILNSSAEGEILVRAEGVRSLPDDLPRIRLRLLAGAEPFAVVRLDSVALLAGGGIAPELCSDQAIVSIANRCFVTGLSLGKYPNRLERPVPNPANNVVEITFQQLEDAQTTFRLWDAQGREVLRPLEGMLPGGRYTIRFAVDELPAGLYFYGVQAGSWSEVGSMMIRR